MEVSKGGDGLNCVPASGGDDFVGRCIVFALEYGSADCWVSCGGVKELVVGIDRVVWWFPDGGVE